MLRDLLVDILSISHYFNDSSAFIRLDPQAYQEMLILLCYRILHRKSLLDEGFANVNEHACYLGLIALVTKLLFQYGRPQKFPYSLLVKSLRQAIEGSLGNELIKKTTCLWLLFLAGPSVFDDAEWTQFKPRIRILFSSLHIDSWETANQKISILPWINAVHNNPGEELWQEITAK